MSSTIQLSVSISQYLTNILDDPDFLAILGNRLQSCSDEAMDLYEAQIIQMCERDMGCVNKNSIPTLLRLSGLNYDDFLLAGKELRYYKLNKTSFKYPSHTYLPDVLEYIAPKLSEAGRFLVDTYIGELQSWAGDYCDKPVRVRLRDKIKNI